VAAHAGKGRSLSKSGVGDEKDAARIRSCRLYLITPAAFEPKAFAPTLKRALDAGDVASLQIRLKPADDSAVRRAIDALMPVAHARDVAVLVNDRADIAADMGCDGAHIGQEDMPYKEARRLLGPDRIVGVTCHASRHLAMEAGEAGADYVAFGAFFPTKTKEPAAHAEPEILTWWSELFEIPCVAVGGITAENAATLVRAGADFLAVSSGVWDFAEGPAAAVKAFNQVMRESAPRR
jgi:thiamine-phosphate pyrophosphorylase